MCWDGRTQSQQVEAEEECLINRVRWGGREGVVEGGRWVGGGGGREGGTDGGEDGREREGGSGGEMHALLFRFHLLK